ncbi:MAG: RHS repeat domain-containing protein, partial [Methylocella sp.]
NQPGVRYYIAPDHLGSPHQITDASGAVVWLWNHDPFGNGDPTDPLGNFSYELRFPGQFFDQGTKLHYNYFRDYDPRLGRYIESDPIGLAGGINTYAYARGNPLVRTDASGLVTGGFSPIPDTSANVCKVGEVIPVCVLQDVLPNTCRYWCESGGYVLDKQRNLGLPCKSIVRQP